MFVEQVVKQYVSSPVRALDLCAAPGGKTTHLHSLLPQGSLLVSNEPVPLRAQILAENVIKWGSPAAVVTRNEPGYRRAGGASARSLRCGAVRCALLG